MRDAAYPYREIEDSGFVYPIIDLGITFYNPLYYDDLIWIHTRPIELERVKLKFDYLITHAETTRPSAAVHQALRPEQGQAGRGGRKNGPPMEDLPGVTATAQLPLSTSPRPRPARSPLRRSGRAARRGGPGHSGPGRAAVRPRRGRDPHARGRLRQVPGHRPRGVAPDGVRRIDPPRRRQPHGGAGDSGRLQKRRHDPGQDARRSDLRRSDGSPPGPAAGSGRGAGGGLPVACEGADLPGAGRVRALVPEPLVVHVARTGAVAEITAPDVPDAGPEASLLGSPFAFDAAMHAACIWGQRFAGVVPFPVGFDGRRVHVPDPSGGELLGLSAPRRSKTRAVS